ncbi:MAG: peptide deformylase [Chitinophagaceae bacterium]|nr:MAG: peptide deformylase [Chitinophagaceae bacterium]
MILPILSYGHPILRRVCEEISPGYEKLDELIENMWQTLYSAKGCGLAAPQVNIPVRLFMVDSKTSFELLREDERAFYFETGDTGIRETFINARITEQSSETWEDEEGCLSIPNLTRIIARPINITINYLDRFFIPHTRKFSGLTARMIQHEYDHIEGKLYLDYIKPVGRKLLKRKLHKISTGLLPAKYPMIYCRK